MLNMKQSLYSQKNTRYLDHMGELWSVYHEDVEDNWPCYNGTTL